MEERHREDLATLERARAALVDDHAAELKRLADERQAAAQRHEREVSELRAAADAHVQQLRNEMTVLAAAVGQVRQGGERGRVVRMWRPCVLSILLLLSLSV